MSEKRALSLKAAQYCENAMGPRCRCRCGGKLHGAARLPKDAPREEYASLPEHDPHKVSAMKSRAERKAEQPPLFPLPETETRPALAVPLRGGGRISIRSPQTERD